MGKERFDTKLNMLLHFLKGSKGLFAICVSAGILSSLFELIRPKVISFTVDSVIGGGPSTDAGMIGDILDSICGIGTVTERLLSVALIIVGLAILSAFFRYLFRLYNSKGAETFVESIRNGLFYQIEHLPNSWQQATHTGDIIQRCTQDVDTIKRFLSEQLTNLVRVMILILLSLIFMLRISPKLTIVPALSIPIIITYSAFFRKKISAQFRKADEEEGVMSAITQENLTGVRVVRAFGRERTEREKFEKQSEISTNEFLKLSKFLSAFWSSGDIIEGIQIVIVVALGAVYAVRGEMSTGEYIAFISYNTMLAWPVRSLGRVISEMSKAGVSIDRVREIMNTPVEEDRADASEPPMDGDIVFDDVSFTYPGDTAPVLSHLSFTVKSGTTVGILGGTGSGKSTLMYLLTGLYPLEEGNGRITIGGVDIAGIKKEHLRRNVGLALQEPFLFSRTLAENIGIARHGADMSQIKRASGIASLEETAERFAKGYDTFVGERGVTLSGGQKQRTSIAQMVIRETPIKIFDDSLSAVDTETDAKIRKALLENAKDSTMIIISHRITTLMQADQIVVINDGRVAEMGTHDELKATGGIYSRICEIQADGLKEEGGAR